MFYKITLTASGGLNSEQITTIKKAFEICQHAYLVNEQGENGGNSHIEGIVEFDTPTTSNVTKRIKTLYDKMGIEVVKGITFKVKKATHYIGALIYASKELQKEGVVVLLKGWEQSWIDKQVKENVKSIPHSMLKKHGSRVTQGTGAGLMYEWCMANNRQISHKQDYLEVVKSMSSAGYMFGQCRHTGLYQDVCALFGDGRAAYSVAESELRFID